MQNKNFDKSDFFAKDDDGLYYHICEGTGDNLMPEDVDDGYVDYIYYDIYNSIKDVHNDDIADGGMILLKQLYKDMTLEQIINEVKDFEDIDVLEAII